MFKLVPRTPLCVLLLILTHDIALGRQRSVQMQANVVLLVSASMGYGDIGVHGVEDIKTPNIDHLARQAVRLTQFYSSAPICTPARAALMTGRYQQRFNMEENLARHDTRDGLNPSETSIAKRFLQNGYATALYGKWHLGFEPQQGPNAHGFQDFFGFHDWSLDYYSHRNIHGERALYQNAELIDREGYLTDLITDRAVSFIDNNAERPFFLCVAYSSALPPYQIPGHPEDVRNEQSWQRGGREDYARMVESMDDGIGRILQSLGDNKIADQTLVIYTHDHGGESLSRNELFFHGFGTLWEGGIHVPCLIRWPGHLPAGTVSDQVAISMDLTATILAAAGISTLPGEQLDGIDLLPILAGEVDRVERTLFWRLNHSGREQKAVRQGKWKYIIDEWNELLFDLEADPSERRDMTYRHPEVRQSLRNALDKWEKSVERENGMRRRR